MKGKDQDVGRAEHEAGDGVPIEVSSLASVRMGVQS